MNIKARRLELAYGDKLDEPDTKIIKPYTNKNISSLGLKQGRKTCKLGIPLVFDNIDELNKLKSINIRWKFICDCDDTPSKELSVYIQVLYKVSFVQKDGCNVYVLYTKDSPLLAYAGRDSKLNILDYLSKFSKVIKINNDKEINSLNIEYIVGKNSEDKSMEEEIFLILSTSLGAKELIGKLEKAIEVNSYYAEVSIEPCKFGENHTIHY